MENISKVVDWQELHSMLSDSDITLRKKGSGLVFISQSTGVKYIEARNESRKKVTSVPEHVFCDNTAKIENGIFQGVRNSNKSKLALIEFGGKIFVLPQTDYGAKRLAETGVKVGQSVSIDKGKVAPARGIERD